MLATIQHVPHGEWVLTMPYNYTFTGLCTLQALQNAELIVGVFQYKFLTPVNECTQKRNKPLLPEANKINGNIVKCALGF